MPLILIIAGIVIVGLGGFFFLQNSADDSITPVTPETPVVRVEETAPTNSEVLTNPDTNSPTISDSPTAAVTQTPNVAATETSIYQNGSYTAAATYIAPSRSSHDVTTTVTLVNDVITASTVTFSGDENKTSSSWQSKFAAAYQAQIVGKKIDDVSLSRVGGASLTTGAFNKALAEVKASAQS